jgi:hypothetical protein
METGTADSNHPDSSTAKAASYYCIIMHLAAGSDLSLQDL